MTYVARRIPCASLFLAAAAVVVFVFPALATALQYDRDAILAGEIWRLVSGHWAHYSFDHFLWDLLAFTALGLACEGRSRTRFLMCVATSVVVISSSVWLVLPQMRAYRGLSGVDSALFTLLIVEIWREGRQSHQAAKVVVAVGCLVAFVSKIAFELLTGNTVFVTGLQPGIVDVPVAHIAGASCGLLVGTLVLRSSDTRRWITRTTQEFPRADYGC